MISRGCASGHESGTGHSGGGCECEYGGISSLSSGVDGTEDLTMCSFCSQSGGAGYKHNVGCVVKFRSWHRSMSHFWCGCGDRNGIGSKCRYGHGNEGFVGSRRLEGSLLTGANLRMESRQFLLYLLDAPLWRQLKGRYWGYGWCTNQE